MNRVPVIYVSGPMSGLPELNFPAFRAADDQLRNWGYRVINPARHGSGGGRTWEDYLRLALGDLLYCDAVATLNGWQASRGATTEVYLARILGMRVASLAEWEPASAKETVMP